MLAKRLRREKALQVLIDPVSKKYISLNPGSLTSVGRTDRELVVSPDFMHR